MEVQIIFDKRDLEHYSIEGLNDFVKVISKNDIDAHLEFIEDVMMKVVIKPKVQDVLGIKWFETKDDYIKYIKDECKKFNGR